MEYMEYCCPPEPTEEEIEAYYADREARLQHACENYGTYSLDECQMAMPLLVDEINNARFKISWLESEIEKLKGGTP